MGVKNFVLKTSSFKLLISSLNKNHEKIYKPDFVLPKKCLLFIYVLHCCKTWADYPSAFRTSRPYFHYWKEPIYLSLHRKEFTWFHYSRTVPAFCCTCPILTDDGCYPLCCSMVSGLSYPYRSKNQQADFLVIAKIRVNLKIW